MEVKRKIVLWCGDAPNQKALAHKIHTRFGLAGIIVERKRNFSGKKRRTLFSKAWDFIQFRPIHQAWHGLQRFYRHGYPEWPSAPMHFLADINTQEAFDLSSALQPDLIVVSGTSLIKQPMLSISASIGIINLHTGLSPYIKGGPNCTNWCIANNDWHLIGNTIMWINAGIDSGNIITTETIDIRNYPSLLKAHIAVMEHAHDLYLRAIHYLLEFHPPYISVPQDELGKGRLFLNKMWKEAQKKQLLVNWKRRRKITLNPYPKTISLPGL